MSDPLNALHETLASLCAKAERCFTEPVKVTLVCRNPAAPNGSRDVVITNDDEELAIAAIRTRLTDPLGKLTPRKDQK